MQPGEDNKIIFSKNLKRELFSNTNSWYVSYRHIFPSECSNLYCHLYHFFFAAEISIGMIDSTIKLQSNIFLYIQSLCYRAIGRAYWNHITTIDHTRQVFINSRLTWQKLVVFHLSQTHSIDFTYFESTSPWYFIYC